MRLLLPLLLVLPLAAQPEDQLRQTFVGRRVAVLIDLPACSAGVDVAVGNPQRIDPQKYSQRLQDCDVAIRQGATATITAVNIKDKHIEFQLDGGGFNQFRDGERPSQRYISTSAPKSSRERDLERELQNEADTDRRRSLQRQLDSERSDRRREDRQARALAEVVAERNQALKAAAAERDRAKALQMGSRFNIRVEAGGLKQEASPELVYRALAGYVDFSEGRTARQTQRPSLPSLRKGMTEMEVADLLGSPGQRSERQEGSLRIVVRRYETPQGRVEAEFLNGVLINFR